MSAVVLSELLCGPVLKFTHTQMRPRDRAAEEPAVSEDLPGLGRPVRAGPVVAGAGTPGYRNRKPPGRCVAVTWWRGACVLGDRGAWAWRARFLKAA